MRLLLDTHLLLWAVATSKRLPPEARKILEDGTNEAYYSAASIWEIAIKSSIARKDFRVDLDALRSALPKMQLVELPITASHAAAVTRLPPIHQDPFDRLLVAQSLAEPLTLLTNDALLAEYGDTVRVV